jgi:cytidyltransferase-like protein
MEKNNMTKVLVFGTFDIFHEGHRNFLKQARKHGDFLRVVVARDQTVKKVKGQNPFNSEQCRKEEIEKSALADDVVLGNLANKYAVIKQFRPDVICLGYDQQFFIDELEDKLKEIGLNKTKIIRLESHQPKIYKSSILKKKMK